MPSDGARKPAQTHSGTKPANQRGAARLAAVQALYQMDVGRQSLEDTLSQFSAHHVFAVGDPKTALRFAAPADIF